MDSIEQVNNEQVAAYDRAIERIGSVAVAARVLGYKTAWGLAKYGKVVPDGKVLLFAQLAGWVSTPHQLRPDLYPHPDDGLPLDMRGKMIMETTDAAGEPRIELVQHPAAGEVAQVVG